MRRAVIKEPPPERIGILVGDAVQNLRSALDHAVYQLAESQLGTLTREVEERLMFPIFGNQNRKGQSAEGSRLFADAVKRGWLGGVPDDAQKSSNRNSRTSGTMATPTTGFGLFSAPLLPNVQPEDVPTMDARDGRRLTSANTRGAATRT